MEERTIRWRRTAGLLAAVALVAAACTAAAAASADRRRGGSASPAEQRRAGTPAARRGGFACENIGGEVSVYATWTGAEQDIVRLAMVAPWQECTGVDDQLHRPARPRHGR